MAASVPTKKFKIPLKKGGESSHPHEASSSTSSSDIAVDNHGGQFRKMCPIRKPNDVTDSMFEEVFQRLARRLGLKSEEAEDKVEYDADLQVESGEKDLVQPPEEILDADLENYSSADGLVENVDSKAIVSVDEIEFGSPEAPISVPKQIRNQKTQTVAASAEKASLTRCTQTVPDVMGERKVGNGEWPKKRPSSGSPGNEAKKLALDISIDNNGTIWLQCDACDKWRLQPVVDALPIPESWTCASMKNSGGATNPCDLPEDAVKESKEKWVVVNRREGDLVYAKMRGYPWWPAIVERSREEADHSIYCRTKRNSAEVVSYHVVFFDLPPTWNWIRAQDILPFEYSAAEVAKRNQRNSILKRHNFQARLDAATALAEKAAALRGAGHRLVAYGYEALLRMSSSARVGRKESVGIQRSGGTAARKAFRARSKGKRSKEDLVDDDQAVPRSPHSPPRPGRAGDDEDGLAVPDEMEGDNELAPHWI